MKHQMKKAGVRSQKNVQYSALALRYFPASNSLEPYSGESLGKGSFQI